MIASRRGRRDPVAWEPHPRPLISFPIAGPGALRWREIFSNRAHEAGMASSQRLLSLVEAGHREHKAMQGSSMQAGFAGRAGGAVSGRLCAICHS